MAIIRGLTRGTVVLSALLLGVHSSGNYLATQGGTGTPFFVHGTSGWPLFIQLVDSRSDPDEDIDVALDDLEEKGVNSILCQIICKWGTDAPNTIDGISPFSGTAFVSSINEAYFARADLIFNKCLERGIVCFIALDYSGYQGDGVQGWYPESVSAGVTAIRNWAQFLGNRYKNQPNIVWVFSGDYSPANTSGTENNPRLLKALRDGLDDAGDTHLRIAHFQTNTDGDEIDGSEWDVYTSYRWFNFPSANSNWPHDAIIDCYNRSPNKPVIGIEFVYELNNGNLGSNVRKNLRAQHWQANASGACGTFWGNEQSGYFGAPNSPFFVSTDWRAVLNSVGSQDFRKIRAFFTAIAWYTLVPNTGNDLITANGGTRGDINYVSRAINAAGTLAVCWRYTTDQYTMDMSKFSGPVRARYYDPVAGTFHDATGTPIANSGTHIFDASTERGSNSGGDTDWVLLLEVV